MPVSPHETEALKDDTSASLGFHEFIQDKSSSSLSKYQDLVVGNRSLWYLFKYEFLTLFLTNLPGLFGLFLRQKLYGLLFKDLGRGIAIGAGVSLRQPGKISIGNSCVIDDLVSLSVRGSDSSGIILNENVFVGRDTVLNVRDGLIEIDQSTSIGSHCRISAFRGKVRIGKYALIAAYCYIGGGNHKTDRTDIPIALQEFEHRGGVTIEDDVWIGAQSVIADGVKIGRGSIIGTCSYVNKDIPEYSIAFGIPATVHKKRM